MSILKENEKIVKQLEDEIEEMSSLIKKTEEDIIERIEMEIKKLKSAMLKSCLE